MTEQNQKTYSEKNAKSNPVDDKDAPEDAANKAEAKKEIGGPSGPEPTRYGDWERGGKCVDF